MSPSTIVIFLIIYFLFSAFGTKKKGKQSGKKSSLPVHPRTVTHPVQAKTVKAEKESSPSPVKPDPSLQEDTMLPPREESLQPTVAVTPHDHSDMFMGSLSTDQTEGSIMDMPSDHSEELFVEKQTVSASPEPARSPLHFSDNEYVNAVILQEVLPRRQRPYCGR